jgi:hypothetical protein
VLDAPDDTTKATFVEKLGALEKIGEPIVARYKVQTTSLALVFSDVVF